MGEAFAVGNRVSVRGLAWDVIEVAPLGAQTLLRLRCAGGDLGGLEWDTLHPAEPVELLRADLRPEAPGPLAAWRLCHQACLRNRYWVRRTCSPHSQAACESSLTRWSH